MLSKLVKIVGLVLLVSLVVVAQSNAAITLQLTDGTNTVTIVDGSVVPGAVDSNPLAGIVTWSGAVGNWVVNVSTGIAKPPFGTGGPLQSVDLSSVNVSSSQAAADLTLTFESDTQSVNPYPFTLKSEIGGTVASGGSLTAKQEVLYNNVAAVTANHGPFGSGAFSDTVWKSGVLPSTFSVKETVTIKAGTETDAFTSFDFKSSVIVPEPISVVVWSLLGLSGMGLAMVRRRKVNARSPWSEETRDAIRNIVNR
jgi:hypothetical protein